MTTNTNFLRNAHYVGSTKGGYHIEAINGRKHITIAVFATWAQMNDAMYNLVVALDEAEAA